MVKVALYLSQQQVDAVQRLADQRGLSFAEILRRLLDKALEVNEEGQATLQKTKV